MKNTAKARSRKKKSFPVKAVAITIGVFLTLAGATAGIYIYKGQKYKTVFFPNYVINGIDASEKTVEEVKHLIASEIDGYTLILEQRGGATEQITKADIGLHSEFDGSLEEMIANQDPMKWWSHRKVESDYQIETMVVYDEGLLAEKINSLQCFSEGYVVSPVNAYMSEYISGQGYTIVPEVAGNQLVRETVEEGITDAIHSLKESISFEELNAYTQPEITSTNEELMTVVEQLNKQVGVTVTYQFGDKTEVLSGDTTHTWLSVNADKTIALDKEEVSAYVKGLASKYNTAYQKKTLKTSYGKTVTISKGFYGWRVNQGAETDQLYSIIRSGESQTREPVYSQKAASHGANDYGDTYVEINLTAQHLFFYKDGKLLVESDFVSGNTSKNYDTPPGAFPLTYKERNATLKGENYATPVSYWMPFNGNVGMHDANWRSSFGGSIYKTSGSHGCVNLPPAVGKLIYENISAGMPVLCYHLEGTESGASSSTAKETTAAATTAAVPETTPAPETTAAVPGTTAAVPGTTAAVPGTTAAVPETTKAIPETSPVPSTNPAPETTAAPETSPTETTKRPAGPGEVNVSETSKRNGPGE